MPNFFQKLRTDRLALDSRVSKECVDAFLLGDKFWDEYCLFSVRDKKIYGFSVLQNALTQYRIIYMLFETKRHVDLERQFILSEIAIVEEELLSLSEVSAFDMAVKTDVGPDESDVKQWKVEIEPLVVLALKPPMTAPVSVVATSAGPVLHERFIKNAVSASHLIWQGIPKSSPPRPPVHLSLIHI